MTTPWMHATTPDPEADRLGDAWDDLIAGRQPNVVGADEELIAVIGQLTTEAAPIHPNLTFRNSLQETLMHSGTLTMGAASPAPTFHPLPKLGRPTEITSPARPRADNIPGRLRSAGSRWAAVAAAIALLFATVGGGYLATRGGGGGTPTRIAAGFAGGTPESTPPNVTKSPVDTGCADVSIYVPCRPNQVVGMALIAGSLYSDAVTDGAVVAEMQGLTVDPGKTISADPSAGSSTGISVDVVVDGAYAATFDGPVTVSRPGLLDTTFEYPAAGTRVELSKGEAVSYASGSRTEITNMLHTRPLLIKSVVLTAPEASDAADDAAATPAAGPAVPGGSVTMDGQGKLPASIDAYPNRELTITLTYAQIIPEAPFPPVVDRGAVVLGPVAPTTNPATPEFPEGFIVWAFESAG